MRPCGIDKIRSDRTSDQKPDVHRFETEEAMNLNAFIRGNKATQQQPPAVIGMMIVSTTLTIIKNISLYLHLSIMYQKRDGYEAPSNIFST
jgi:hypothetical protein